LRSEILLLELNNMIIDQLLKEKKKKKEEPIAFSIYDKQKKAIRNISETP
jgi:hypothetical protein